jgi:hypothetical protein
MSEQRTRRHVDRRTVVRAGVWTIPVVTLATAAPALAVSGTTGSLSFDTFNLFGTGYNGQGKPTTAETQIQVQNVWTTGGPTLATITVQVTYSNSRVDGSAATILSGSGWSAGAPVKNGGSWLYSFVWAGSLAQSASTSTLSYTVPLKNASSGQMDISGVASATGVTSATAAASTNL